MKRVLILFLFLATFVVQVTGQYVTLEGRQFKDEKGDNFYPVVCNYIVDYFYTTDTTSFFLSPNIINDGWGYECDGLSTCDTQFYHNFQQIKHMGFNTIRLFGAQPVYLDTLNGSRPGFRIGAYKRNANESYQYFLTSPYENDWITQNIFDMIDRVLVQASHAGLKVILLTGGAKGRFYSVLDTLFYPEYLGALSHHIANHSPRSAREALLAYDLFNEPSQSDQTSWPWDTTGHSKQDICNRVATWYDALKINDSIHMITIGAGGFRDILEYDLSVLKIDFASPHFYPVKMIYEPDSIRFNKMVNRVQGHFYWLSKNSHMPFIIGETGFSAQANIPPETGTHGDTSEQRQYAEKTLQMTKECKGSGYSWWIYQNLWWPSANQKYFGLLDYGACTSPPCESLEKPVVKAFENFDTATPQNPCVPPANYYDPMNHQIFAPGTNIIHGHVEDDDGNPIRDAVVFGTTYCKYDYVKRIPIYNYHYTFTDSTGNFTIIPFDTVFPAIPNKIKNLYISASGSERIFRQDSNQCYPLIDSATYQLTQLKWDYDEELIDDTITTYRVVQGWNTVSVTDVVIQSGAEVDINARSEVQVNTNFEANQGSEVSIKCTETFPFCMDYDGLNKKNTSLVQQATSDENPADIELSFLITDELFGFTVFPNPGKGLFTVKVTQPDAVKEELRVEIIDFLGINIVRMLTKETTFSLDISSVSKGVYFIKISTNTDSQTKKLIIQ